MSALHDDYNIDGTLSPWRKNIRKKLFPWSQKHATLTLLSGGIFELVMVIVYVMNMVCLALYDTYDVHGKNPRNSVLKSFDLFFSILYVVEIVVRTIAFGGKKLRHPLRILDCGVVMTNFVFIILFFSGVSPSVTNVSLLSLRCTLRTLRPFFIVTDFPSIRIFLVATTQALLRLTDVVLLLLMFLVWFGVSSVYSYGAALQTRCVNQLYIDATSGVFADHTTLLPVITFVNVTEPPLNASEAPSVSEQEVMNWIPAAAYLVHTMIDDNQWSLHDFVCGSDLFESQSTFSDMLVARLYAMERSRPRGGSASHTQTPSLSLSWSVSSPQFSQHIDRFALNETNFELLQFIERSYAVRAKLACSLEQTCDTSWEGPMRGITCPYGFKCTDTYHDPYDELVGFDNLAIAILTLYTCVSFQLWYEVMFWTADSTDFVAYVFFMLVLVIGCYMIVNLTVVVLTVEFELAKAAERKSLARQLGDFSAQNTTAKFLDIVSSAVKISGAVGKGLLGGIGNLSNLGRKKEKDKNKDQEKKKHKSKGGTQSPDGTAALTVPLLAGQVPDGAPTRTPATTPPPEASEESPEAQPADSETAKKEDQQQIHWLRTWVFDKIVKTKWFNYLCNLVIVANVGFLMAEHYGMSQKTEDLLDDFNIAFTIFFSVEAVMRLTAEVFSQFIKSFFNVFDVAIVIVSWLDIALEGVDVPVIRAFRILRILKLLKGFPSLYGWIMYIAKVTKSSPMLVFMLLLQMFTFSCMGMQLWGGQLCGITGEESSPMSLTVTLPRLPIPNVTNETTYYTKTVVLEPLPSTVCEGLPRANFDTFGQAMITSFQILSADDWNFVMYDCMKASGWWVAVPFSVFFYVGNFILLNIFIAVLLSAGSEKSESQRLAELAAEEKEQMRRAQKAQQEKRMDDEEEKADEEERQRAALLEAPADAEETDTESIASSVPTVERAIETTFVTKHGKQVKKSTADMTVDHFFRLWDRSSRWTKTIVLSSSCQVFMGLVILFGSFAEGLEDPIAAPDSALLATLEKIDVIVTVIYVVELLINIHAFGLIRKQTSYLRRDLANVFDFVLVVISVLGVATTSLRSNSIIRGIKVLRALRPLRLVKRSPGMKLVLRALIGALPEMQNVVIIAFGIFSIWGIAGVNMLAGKMQSCYIGDVHVPSLSLANCTALGGQFINDGPHFDNVFAAMLALFQIATLEGWTSIMYRAMDAVGPGEAPMRGSSKTVSIYFMLLAAFAGLFLTNIFISVLIDAYNREKRKVSLQRSLLTTKEQEAWLISVKRLAKFMPEKTDLVIEGSILDQMKGHQKKFQQTCRRISRSVTFERIVLALIFLNFIAMAVERFPQPDSWTRAVDTMNVVFAILFGVEAAFKIYAESWHGYISSKWNCVDFLVAICSVLAIIFARVVNPRATSLIRSLRILRLARITRGYFAIDKMISKFGHALLSLGHVFAVIVLVFFIFAATGMKMFGRVKRGVFGVTSGTDRHSNFSGIGASLLLLARVMTGGNWADVMWNCSEDPPFCDPSIGECGPASPVPQLFFVLYVIASVYVLRNLLTAVLLDSFASTGQDHALSKNDARAFYGTWEAFDPTLSLQIAPFDLLNFLRGLPRSSAFSFSRLGKKTRVGQELRFLTALKMKSLHDKLPLALVVDTLCQVVFYVPMPEGAEFNKNVQNMEKNVFETLGSTMAGMSSQVWGLTSDVVKKATKEIGGQVKQLGKDFGDVAQKWIVEMQKAEEDEGDNPKDPAAPAPDGATAQQAAATATGDQDANLAPAENMYELFGERVTELEMAQKLASYVFLNFAFSQRNKRISSKKVREIALLQAQRSADEADDVNEPDERTETDSQPRSEMTPRSKSTFRLRLPISWGGQRSVLRKTSQTQESPTRRWGSTARAIMPHPNSGFADSLQDSFTPPSSRISGAGSPNRFSSSVNRSWHPPLPSLLQDQEMHEFSTSANAVEPSPTALLDPTIRREQRKKLLCPTLQGFAEKLLSYIQAIDVFVDISAPAPPSGHSSSTSDAAVNEARTKQLKNLLLFALPFSASIAGLVRDGVSYWSSKLSEESRAKIKLPPQGEATSAESLSAIIPLVESELELLKSQLERQRFALKGQPILDEEVFQTASSEIETSHLFHSDFSCPCKDFDAWLERAEQLLWALVLERHSALVNSASCSLQLRHIAPRPARPRHQQPADALHVMIKTLSLLRMCVTIWPQHKSDKSLLSHNNSAMLHLLRAASKSENNANVEVQTEPRSLLTLLNSDLYENQDAEATAEEWSNENVNDVFRDLLRDNSLDDWDENDPRVADILNFFSNFTAKSPAVHLPQRDSVSDEGGEASGNDVLSSKPGALAPQATSPSAFDAVPTVEVLYSSAKCVVEGVGSLVKAVYPTFIGRTKRSASTIVGMAALHECEVQNLFRSSIDRIFGAQLQKQIAFQYCSDTVRAREDTLKKWRADVQVLNELERIRASSELTSPEIPVEFVLSNRLPLHEICARLQALCAVAKRTEVLRKRVLQVLRGEGSCRTTAAVHSLYELCNTQNALLQAVSRLNVYEVAGAAASARSDGNPGLWDFDALCDASAAAVPEMPTALRESLRSQIDHVTWARGTNASGSMLVERCRSMFAAGELASLQGVSSIDALCESLLELVDVGLVVHSLNSSYVVDEESLFVKKMKLKLRSGGGRLELLSRATTIPVKVIDLAEIEEIIRHDEGSAATKSALGTPLTIIYNGYGNESSVSTPEPVRFHSLSPPRRGGGSEPRQHRAKPSAARSNIEVSPTSPMKPAANVATRQILMLHLPAAVEYHHWVAVLRCAVELEKLRQRPGQALSLRSAVDV